MGLGRTGLLRVGALRLHNFGTNWACRPCGVMKRILSLPLLLISTAAFAHSAGLDGHGGHNGRAAGTYHFHQGLLAGEAFATKEQATTALQVEVAPARQMSFQGPNWRLSLLGRFA